MDINQINKEAIPILKSFPNGRLFFDAENIWLEAYAFDHDEIDNPGIPIPENINLMITSGYVKDQSGTEHIVSAAYGYDDRVYFVSIDYSSIRYTYDCNRAQWIDSNH